MQSPTPVPAPGPLTPSSTPVSWPGYVMHFAASVLQLIMPTGALLPLLQAPVSCCCGWHSSGFIGAGLSAGPAAYNCDAYRGIMPLGGIGPGGFQPPQLGRYADLDVSYWSRSNRDTYADVTIATASMDQYNAFLFSGRASNNAVITRLPGDPLITEGLFSVQAGALAFVHASASIVNGTSIPMAVSVYSTCFRGPLADEKLGHINTSVTDRCVYWPEMTYYVKAHVANVSLASIESVTIHLRSDMPGPPGSFVDLQLPELPRVAAPPPDVCATRVPPTRPVPPVPPVPSVSGSCDRSRNAVSLVRPLDFMTHACVALPFRCLQAFEKFLASQFGPLNGLHMLIISGGGLVLFIVLTILCCKWRRRVALRKAGAEVARRQAAKYKQSAVGRGARGPRATMALLGSHPQCQCLPSARPPAAGCCRRRPTQCCEPPRQNPTQLLVLAPAVASCVDCPPRCWSQPRQHEH